MIIWPQKYRLAGAMNFICRSRCVKVRIKKEIVKRKLGNCIMLSVRDKKSTGLIFFESR
jgi:hypothetical protein